MPQGKQNIPATGEFSQGFKNLEVKKWMQMKKK